jgi:GNAT superfamily N-acetyltransferase
MSANELNIRSATTGDIPALVALLSSLFSIEADFDIDTERQECGLALMLERPDERCILLAESDGKIVGMVTLQVLISTAEGGPVGLIEDMVVHESARGRGVGKKLLAAMETWAWERGLTRLQLLADNANTGALRFYEREGWDTTQLVCRRKKNT